MTKITAVICNLSFFLTTASLLPVAGASDIFADPSVVSMTIAAPFKTLIQQGRLVPTGKQTPWSLGELTIGDKENSHDYKIAIKVRGQSSRDELQFPKLKINIKEKNGEDPGFDKLRLGTHGFNKDSNAFTMIGRITSSKSVYREAAVYDVLSALEIPTMHYRRALITYQENELSEAPPIVKPALLLESDEAIAQRFQGEVIDDQALAKDFLQTAASEAQIARAIMAETLIGNRDFLIPLSPDEKNQIYKRPRNVIVVKRADHTAALLIEDFDLANAVTNLAALTPVSVPGFEGRSFLYYSVLQSLQNLKLNVEPSVFIQQRQFFLEKKPLILKTIAHANVDRYGKTIFRKTVENFYEVLALPEFNLPVAQ